LRFRHPLAEAGPSSQCDEPSQMSSPENNSNTEIDRSLAYLVKHGGVVNLYTLLKEVDPPVSEIPDILNVYQWSYKDIQKLPTSEHKDWIKACFMELSSLHDRHIYNLVDAPKGWRIISNQWVFDMKTD